MLAYDGTLGEGERGLGLASQAMTTLTTATTTCLTYYALYNTLRAPRPPSITTNPHTHHQVTSWKLSEFARKVELEATAARNRAKAEGDHKVAGRSVGDQPFQHPTPLSYHHPNRTIPYHPTTFCRRASLTHPNVFLARARQPTPRCANRVLGQPTPRQRGALAPCRPWWSYRAR